MTDRLPAGARLGPVHLQVSRVARSREYYERVLGLRVVSETGGRVVLAADGDDAPLVELVERSDARPVKPNSVLGLYHFAVLLPDRPSLGRFLPHLRALGGRVGMADHAVSESVYLTDPDGLGIEVYADRPQATWRRDSSGQLFMTTAPLDVQSVVDSAAGHPWEGAPAGTTIGHVHLHVGDLARASAFYDDALGFDKTMWTYPGALFFAAGDYHHHVGTNVWASGPPVAEDQARLLFWEIILPSSTDLDDVLARAGTMMDVRREPTGALTAVDPWGTTVRLRT